MTWISLLDPEICGRVCLTLLHSLWQAAALWGLAWCCGRFLRRRAVERQYAFHVAALLGVMIALPITYSLTTFPEQQSILPSDVVATANASARPGPSTDAAAVAPAPLPASLPVSNVDAVIDIQDTTLPTTAIQSAAMPENDDTAQAWLTWTPWIVLAYGVCVALFLFRLAAAVIGTGRLAKQAMPITEGPIYSALCAQAERWSLKIVPALVHTERIVVPTVIGLLKPTILLPTSAISGMSVAELELILAHELAHVRRFDMWINLLQRLAEAALFFNPFLWCLSRRVSRLREYCCDDMTCDLDTDTTVEPRLRYVAALLRVVELTRSGAADTADLAALAATGRSPSELRRRVARLFGRPVAEPWRFTPGGVLTLVLSAVLLTVGVPAVNSQAEAPQDQTEEATSDDQFQFRLTVVGPDKKPVPHAKLDVRSELKFLVENIQQGRFTRNHNYGTLATCDENGVFAISQTKRPKRFSVSIKHPGYGPYWAEWDSSSHPQAIPMQFTAELDAGWSVGGVVVDDAGRPIKGVEVHPSVDFKKRPGDARQLGMGKRIKTDKQGRWRFDMVPASKNDIHLSFSHHEFQALRKRYPRNGFEVKLDANPTARFELQPGLVIRGTVTDESGQPIQGALVRTKFRNDLREAETNERGVFRLTGCEPVMARIVVSAKGKALDLKEVRVGPDMEPVNFTLKPGGKIRVRVVDENGKGIPKARIFFQRWRGHIDYFEFNHVKRDTDENGVWEWDEAPLDEIQADICRPGGMQLPYQSLVARDEEYVFTPPQALVVSGSVVDAKTKQPIKKFRVTQGFGGPNLGPGTQWSNRSRYEATGGAYQTQFDRMYDAHFVRIEADGYKVAVSRKINADEGQVKINFELKPAKDIVATIVARNGKPAAEAKIALGVAGSQISINNGDINDGSTYATKLRADEKGRFSFPNRSEPFQLVITHPAGFAHLKSIDGPIPRRIELTPWARVEGTFRVGKDIAPNVVLSGGVEGIHSYGNDVPNIFTHYETTTGKDGKYAFERMFPGKGRIGRRILLMVDDGATEVTSSSRVAADFFSGNTTRLDLGGTGSPVVGRLKPPRRHRGKVLWNFALVTVEADLTPPPMPDPPPDIANDAQKRQLWWEEWKNSDAGQAWSAAYQSYEQRRSEFPYITASIARDGTFRIDDVPEGDYVLSVLFTQPKYDVGMIRALRFTVPADDKAPTSEPIDLGRITLE